MSEIIQCPSCSKKFRLPATPPAEFTCTNCQTVMDLSDFGGEPAAAAAAPAGGGAPSTRRKRAAGGGGPSRSGGGKGGGASRSRGGGGASRARGGGGSRARGGSRGRGRPAPDEYEDEGEGRRGFERKKNNNGLVIGSIAAVAVAIVLAVVLMNKGDDTPAGETAGTGSGTGVAGVDPMGVVQPVPGLPGNPAGVVPAAGATGTTPAGTAKTPAGATPVAAPKKPKSGRQRMSGIKLRAFDWPEEVDAETRKAAETHVENMLEWGGADGDRGEAWFIKKGNMMAGRLISEFPTIIDGSDSENIRKSKLMVLDRTLSKMDGTIERTWRRRNRITHVSSDQVILSRLKAWTSWWQQGLWKTPVKPWTTRDDEIDDEAKAKKEAKGDGYKKSAGK